MKRIIIILTVVLAGMIFNLEASKLSAYETNEKMIEFVTFDSDVVYRAYYAPGTDLTKLEIPDAPEKDGYIFIGWSIEIPEEMPNYHMRIHAKYIQSEVIINEEL